MGTLLFMIVGSVVVFLLYAVAGVLLSFCAPRLPFKPSTDERIERIIALSKVARGERVVDLGSGDGRMVIAFAKGGALVDGYEINPLLVWWSRRKIKELHLQDRASIYRQNFFHADLSGYDVFALYGISTIMKQLEAFLRPQMKSGARVIVNGVAFQGWQPAVEQGGVRVYKA